MSAYESKAGFRGAGRKRKRELHSSSTFAYPSDSEIQLENPSVSTHYESVPENAKVSNYLNKLKSANGNQNSFLKIRVSTSEAEYFSKEIIQYLKESFFIHELTKSEPVPGVIERYLTLIGKSEDISKAALFIAFTTNARLNNFTKSEVFTLKSSNYHLEVLIPQSIRVPPSSNISVTSTLNYYQNSVLNVASLKGDFTSCFHIMVSLAVELSKIQYIEDTRIVQQRLLGNVIDPNLLERTDAQQQLLVANRNRVLSYIKDLSIKS